MPPRPSTPHPAPTVLIYNHPILLLLPHHPRSLLGPDGDGRPVSCLGPLGLGLQLANVPANSDLFINSYKNLSATRDNFACNFDLVFGQ